MTPTDIDVKRLFPEGKHFIGGEFVPARSSETLDIIDPATQETLLTVPRGTKEDIDAAIDAPSEAFKSWRDMNPTDRSYLLWKWDELCDVHSEPAKDASLTCMYIAKLALEAGNPVRRIQSGDWLRSRSRHGYNSPR